MVGLQEFKQTEIGGIPKEWEVAKIWDIADVRGGKRIPKGHALIDVKTPYPYIRVVDFKNMSIDTSNIKYLLPETHKLIKRYTISSNDVCISIAGTIGLAGLIPEELNGANLTENAAKLCNLKNITREFLAYALNSSIGQKQVSVLAGKAQQPKLALFRIEKIKLPLPPLPEQQKIAEILSTVDEAVGKTDQAIERTQRLKKGLMQKLFTKGVVDSRQHTGERKFKDTEIGRIPEEWKVVKLKEIADLNRGKFAHRPRNDPKFYGGRIPFIQTGDISEANGIIKNYSQTLNEEGLKISKLFKKGTTVISIAGNIGDVGILDFDACFPDSVVGIKVNSKADHLFLMYLFQEFKYKLSSIAPRSTQKNINLEILESFSLPLPPIPEQRKISDILRTVDKRLELLRARREKLERIKKGLMNDLLIGKRRVKL